LRKEDCYLEKERLQVVEKEEGVESKDNVAKWTCRGYLCCAAKFVYSSLWRTFHQQDTALLLYNTEWPPQKLHFFHIHYIYGTVQNKVKQILPLHGLLNTVIHVLTFISRSSTHISHSVITQVPLSYSIFSSVSSSVSILFTG